MPRIELGRIAGVPVFLDMFFVLVLILFTYPYFTQGSSQFFSAGVVIVIGLLASILLHEVGHALAGRFFKAPVAFIELTGLGGIAHFERSLPTSAFKRSVIYLAGPAANLILWHAFDWLASAAMSFVLSSSTTPVILRPACWREFAITYKLLRMIYPSASPPGFIICSRTTLLMMLTKHLMHSSI